MKKAILAIVVLVVLVVGGGVFYLINNLDSLVKAAIEKYGSEAVKTAVRVDAVKIRLQEGKATINGLTIANPAGFSYEHAFTLNEITVDIDLERISEDLIAIELIKTIKPQVFFEVNEERKGNLMVLKDNLGIKSSKAEQPAKPAPDTKPINLDIKTIVFEGAPLQAKIVPLKNREYQLKLPSLRLNGLKGTPEQVSKQVMDQLIAHAQTAIKKKGLDQELAAVKAKLKAKVDEKVDEAKSELKQKADSKVEEQKQKAKEGLKRLF